MKDYYEILEVSRKASSEIIEKAYKTLAKKYHPDTQANANVKFAEEKFKEIGEAYEILSNASKRSEYDVKLIEMERKAEESKLSERVYSNNKSSPASEINRQENVINNAVEQAYQDAYVQRLKDYGYKIKYQKSFKEIIKIIISILLTLLVIIIVGIILWNIPSTREKLISLYNDNIFLKILLKPFIK